MKQVFFLFYTMVLPDIYQEVILLLEELYIGSSDIIVVKIFLHIVVIM